MHRTLNLLAALLFLATVAHAQLAATQPEGFLVYGTYALTHVSKVPNQSGTNQAGTTSISSSGLGLGVTFNLHTFSTVSVGLDFRFAYVPHNAANINDTDSGKTNMETGGVKVTFHPRRLPIHPYAQISAGGLTANAANSAGGNVSSHWAVFQYIAGIDYPILRHVSFRAIELGAGQGTTSNPSATQPSTNVFTLSSGMAFCF